MLTFISNLLQSNPLKLDQVVQTIQALLKAGHLDCAGLSALPEPARSQMVALIRDVLCGYPTPRMGLPLLIQCLSEELFDFSQQTALDFLAQIPAPETWDWNDPALDI